MPLPIPTLIEARDGEPVKLLMQNTRHRFGFGPAVAARGISSTYLGPVVRVRSGDTIPFHVENRLEEETTVWTARRVLYLIIALLVIIAFLVYMFYPLISGVQNHPQYIPDADDYQQTLLLRF